MSQRFSIKAELGRMDRGITDMQPEWGTTLHWLRFDEDASGVDDIYDVGAPRAFRDPLYVPAVWVVRIEGRDQRSADGLYTADTLQAAVAYASLRDILGWVDIEKDIPNYLRDHVIYDGLHFKLEEAVVAGQLRERDIMVGLRFRMVRGAERVYDSLG